MSFHRIVLLVVLILVVGQPAYASIDLTLYNSTSLLDSDGLTPLKGNLVVGDMLQLIWVGPNGLLDSPDPLGNPGADDILLHAGHVGTGLPSNPNAGWYADTGILFDSALQGSNAYVRFWNGINAASSDHFGDSMTFALPTGDAFGMAELDFSPQSFSPHIADQPFGSPIPEPTSIVTLGWLFLLAVCRRPSGKHGRSGSALPRNAAILVLLSALSVSAQIEAPLDVMASSPIYGQQGPPLAGNNPNAAAFGFPVTPGCIVQIIHAGANHAADAPDSTGAVTGDDAVLASTTIGQGIVPNLSNPGTFSTSFYPPPAQGAKVYARVWNTASIEAATYWTQSDLFTVSGLAVFDVSVAGVSMTRMPAQVDPTSHDADLDGVSDYAELLAHTDPIVPDAPPPGSYALTVNNGSGSGSYTNGTIVAVTAAVPPSGQVFDQWTGATVANAFAASTTLTMTASDATVTATYKLAPIGSILFAPTNGPAGTLVTITGTGFTEVTNVLFNGTSAAFVIDSDLQITAIVPNAASTGPITVSGPGGTMITEEEFTLTPGVELAAVWVADTSNHRLQKTTNGVDWTVIGEGEFRNPESVAASTDGQTIYVADTKLNRIAVSTDGGATWADFVDADVVKAPQGVVVALNGDLYVADTKNHRILRFDGGDAGAMTVLLDASQVKTPIGLAISADNTLFIADSKNSRILAVANAETTNAVEVVTTDVKTPQGVAADNDGNLYVADTGNSRILFFASGTGTPVVVAESGDVKKPEGITVCRFASGPFSTNNILFVSDTGHSQILGKADPDLAGAFTILGVKGSAEGQFNKPGKIR